MSPLLTMSSAAVDAGPVSAQPVETFRVTCRHPIDLDVGEIQPIGDGWWRIGLMRSRDESGERLVLLQHCGPEARKWIDTKLPDVGEPIFTGWNTAKLIEVHFDAQGRASKVRLSLT